MNIKQLVAELSKYDDNLLVTYTCPDGGFFDILEISERTLELNINKRGYFGEHEMARDNPSRPTSRAIIFY